MSYRGDRQQRIIPAYAGSTADRATSAGRARDHPRIRGEHLPDDVRFNVDGGSSPHTRGAPRRRRWRPAGRWIIPAYAGSTAVDVQARLTWRDHPRIRGEHMMPEATIAAICGSSPHTRGALELSRMASRRHGIIPAYAGSTCRRETPDSPGPDHPRIRGEHKAPRPGGGPPPGSSPHTRGAPSPGTGSAAPETDHPRIRGEHFDFGRAVVVAGGSSPHTRGALHLQDRHHESRRIIPAYAGSTTACPPRNSGPADHPRIRGEHAVGEIIHLVFSGSSPHTRGAH